MKKLQKIGWILSYFQIIVLMTFGTCTQGDDDPWRASLIYSVVPFLGLILILVSSRNYRRSLIGIPHILSLFLILYNTPPYWLRVTIQGQHICAGFDKGYGGAYEPQLWHRLWAPWVTILGLSFVVIGFLHLKNHIRFKNTEPHAQQ